MLIRCEKCSTLYELDEKLLPPKGAPVQCSKCQFVFTAHPTSPGESPGGSAESDPARASGPRASAPEATLAASPAASEPPAAASVPQPVRSAVSTATHPEAGPGTARSGKRADAASAPAPPSREQQFTPDGRPIRKVQLPVEEPSPMGPRHSLGRVPNSSASRRSRRWASLVVPLAVLLLLVAAFLAWRMFIRRPHPAATPPRAEGQSLLLFRGEGAESHSSLQLPGAGGERHAQLQLRSAGARPPLELARRGRA